MLREGKTEAEVFRTGMTECLEDARKKPETLYRQRTRRISGCGLLAPVSLR